MTTANEQRSKLPQKTVASIRKDIFSYDGTFTNLSEAMLLKLSDALAPYYPLSEDEDSAALLLREWLTARQVSEDAAQHLKRLEELSQAAVREWRNVVDQWYHEREYRSERRFHEERHPEMHSEMLHKELYHELKSGDPRGLIMAMERLIEESLAKNVRLTVGSPPQVQVSDELTRLAMKVTEDTRKELSTYVDRVAKAKQFLVRYVQNVVACEAIQPEDK